MARPRNLTVDYLNRIKSSDRFQILERCENPNNCIIRFTSCGHKKEYQISQIHKREPYCEICKESRIRDSFAKSNFELIKPLQSGDTKARYETRLCKCLICGTFRVLLPNQNSRYRCGICNLNKINLIVPENYEIVNKIDKSYVRLRHKTCGNEMDVQVSNLKRYIRDCNYCSDEKQMVKSYVYLFQVTIEQNLYIKIGKSNAPYLRKLSITKNPDDTKFLKSIRFNSQKDAFAFERYLLNKYKTYQICPAYCRNFLESGYSEIFNLGIQQLLLNELNQEELKHEQNQHN